VKEKPRSVDELSSKGVYIMYITLGSKKRLKVGSLKLQSFDAGLFAYVGSARGPGGLRGRLRRHMGLKGRPRALHWHVDHIISNPDSKIVGFHVLEGASEHLVAEKVGSFARVSFRGFGCSDCNCNSHFFYLGKDLRILRKLKEELRNCECITSVAFIGSEGT